MIQWLKKLLNNKETSQADVVIDNNDTPKTLTLEQATVLVQEKIRDKNANLKEVNKSIELAMAGDKAASEKLQEIILNILIDNKVNIKGLSPKDAAFEIYANNWGLGRVEKYYRDPTVDEIRVNRPDNVWIVKRGKARRIPEKFANEEEVEKVIKRMILEDVGISLDRSNPRIESVRKDGSRLTATSFPISPTWTFVLRKHGTFKTTLDNYINSGTLDANLWNALSVLVRGRASLLVSGNPGSGKTTLVRKLVGELNNSLRVLVIGKDSELLIANYYPERDVIELEEHSQVGVSMKALFDIILRYSPDIIITEEFRNSVEALEAVRACTKGLPGSMATCHFNSPEEALEGTGLMLIEEGLNLSLDLAKLRVARAFNVIVQLYGDTISGVKKILSVTEIYVTPEGVIEHKELIRWKPAGDEFLGEGKWEYVNNPSDALLRHLLKSIPREDVENVGWETSCIA